ncbi:pirin family protein [Paraneptunicella aestuarii]|uniref:pirin family protein n=1 Tax=Paraneptunicella aestuarii TaxID=2831148 RepID=UPI001E2F963F|nr:pirin family protein [Paraneptunicella aestuarii]UAA39850.1 pirin family protein [Paraneptunicella aestuarii]
MLQLRAANERGKADFGWLQSAHSFSFGRYYDPEHMGHGQLLVINDDTVAPGAGFGTHPHQNMEILSYVTKGQIAHKDSQGNEFIVPEGEFQLMSAGSGISHSEYNASKQEELKFLQIWVKPNVQNTQPGYQQKHFAQNQAEQLIFSPDGAEGSLQIKQQAWLHRVNLNAGEDWQFTLERTLNAYIHVTKGSLVLNDKLNMQAGDGVKISDESALSVQPEQAVEFLLFEV